jgi:hypothetical protein
MHFRSTFRSAFLLALLALPVLAGTNRWTIKGPEGGAVTKLAFDSLNPTIVYAATDNGIFRSSDGGQHWIAASELLGTSVLDVAVAISDPQKVYASSAYGLYKSTDRGLTWKTVHPFGSYKLAVSPSNANVVYSVSGEGQSIPQMAESRLEAPVQDFRQVPAAPRWSSTRRIPTSFTSPSCLQVASTNRRTVALIGQQSTMVW